MVSDRVYQLDRFGLDVPAAADQKLNLPAHQLLLQVFKDKL